MDALRSEPVRNEVRAGLVRLCGLLVVTLMVLCLPGSANAAWAPPGNANSLLSGLPLQFEANRGQADATVRYLARGNGYTLALTPQAALFTLAGAPGQPVAPAHIRLLFAGARSHPVLSGEKVLAGVVNYYFGQNPEQWHSGIPTYAEVKYEELYPGIDLLFYGNRGQLEYDFQIAPGRNPGAIAVEVQGAESLTLDRAGDLLIQTGTGDLRLHKPVLYQVVDGTRRSIAGGFVLKGERQFGFAVGAYDRDLPLVIDPVLTYSTFYGGTSDDFANGIAVDGDGNLYITGATNSTDLLVQNPHQGGLAGDGGIHCPSDEVANRVCYDTFVVKLNPAGSTVLYATYLGNPGDDQGMAIAADGDGNAYITGQVSLNSEALPEFWIYKYILAVKLDPTGALVYGKALPGLIGNGIAVDSAGRAYITGQTDRSDTPVTPNAIQLERKETLEAFVVVLDPDGNTNYYGTYLGNLGDYCEECSSSGNAIALDDDGLIYVTGQAAPPFPVTTNAFQTTFNGFFWKAFVAKIDPTRNGTAGLLYSTFLGGSGSDFGKAIVLDAAGRVYVAGDSQSEDFPVTAGAYDQSCGTDSLCNRPQSTTCDPQIPGLPPECYQSNIPDAFVAKLDLSKSGAAGLVFASFLGSSGMERANGVAVDKTGNIYVTGATFSLDFPTERPLQDSFGGGNTDAYVVKFDPSGSDLVYSTLLGGGGDDEGLGIVINPDGEACVAGFTGSGAFPTKNPILTRMVGWDAFVARIGDTAGPNPEEFETLLPLLAKLGTPAGGGPNLLQNPGFENSSSEIDPWVAREGTTWQVNSDIKHSGAHSLNLYSGTNGNDSVYQVVTVPADATSVGLDYWYYWLSTETKPNADKVCVALFAPGASSPAWERCIDVAGKGTQDWAQAQYTISGAELSVLKGKNLEVTLSVVTDGESFTEAWLDDLSLVVTQ